MFDLGFEKLAKPEILYTALKVVIILACGFLLLKVLNFSLGKITKRRFSQQSSMLIRKAVFYTGLFVIIVTVLRQLGFNLTALLGAAGVAGIAIGFASQTSISNIISGLFLISEKPFSIGDIIRVGDLTGIILSIDLLSLKLRTFDNLYVRIPNEHLIKSQVINITRFPIRRLDIRVSVAYREDIAQVRNILLDISAHNSYCLDNPEPLFVIESFDDSGIRLLLGAWFSKTDYLALKNSLMLEIKERFDRERIEIAFPHISVYAGSKTQPFPVEMVETHPGGEDDHEKR
ncbi:MAG: hypothetical protein AMS17_01130 [Spirochaetes bacterium DG_61]|jgi:small-conductance mechanosensitive channel|nr:MAG: hypothetical protein AMS17_01130 [Spirochaetes bacterium DG_61]